MPKYVFVSGGVLSGLGKGITAASVGLLLKSRGFAVTAMKCDMYLNIDAGTMNPIEHGEVFVTADGLETDQDLGHYERFLSTTLSRENYLTSGQIYQIVLNKERALEYGGVCVQPYHHLPPEIISRWQAAARKHKAEIIVVELGGTVGEYEGLLFFEAIRRLKLKHPGDVALIHVGYLPAPPSIGELKSKPLQQSVIQLNALGLQPDIIVARAEKLIDKKRKEKIALASGLSEDDIIANPDVESIYEVPLVLNEQTLGDKVSAKLGLKPRRHDLREWKKLIQRIKKPHPSVTIGMVGKYQKTGDYTLTDSYVCVVEALKHAGWANGVKPELKWIDSQILEPMSDREVTDVMQDLDGVIVPQGWGSRGTEGKIKAIQYAREHKIPYLGLCFGMQMGVIEFARHVCGLSRANSSEVNPRTPHPVVHIMPHQQDYLKKKQYGGTIRLGQWPCLVRPGTILEEAYQEYRIQNSGVRMEKSRKKKNDSMIVQERHRHRYEVNNRYRRSLEARGMVFSGTSPDGKLIEAFELPRTTHPFFLATQFHPEYQSWPLAPHPIFTGFVRATKGM